MSDPDVVRAPGFRLDRLEVYNWGTFHDKIWTLQAGGGNALMTGDIGSGKSTLVDALTTLLVPAHRAAYNKAAGAEARERSLKSYVLGYHKSEQGEGGPRSRPVALRDGSSYSVILALFRDHPSDQAVTIAQVFWMREGESTPERCYVVADRALSIVESFTAFGSQMP